MGKATPITEADVASTKAPAWPADKVERRPLVSLTPYARNARLHTAEQVAQIAASMREWGWTSPVLVDEDGVIIAGHGRVLAAAELGFDEAPVMVAAGWSDEQKRAYSIADNKLALLAEWDADFLKDELRAIAASGFDFTTTGFTTDEFEEMFASATAPDQFPQYGETIETAHQCPKCGFKWSGKAE